MSNKIPYYYNLNLTRSMSEAWNTFPRQYHHTVRKKKDPLGCPHQKFRKLYILFTTHSFQINFYQMRIKENFMGCQNKAKSLVYTS